MAYNDKRAANKWQERKEQKEQSYYTNPFGGTGVTVVGPGENKVALQDKRLLRLRKRHDRESLEALKDLQILGTF